jgi:DNA-binding transcriptional ArsR family regulator
MLWEVSVVEQRYQAVLEVIRDGASIIDIATRVGVSRQTVHNWLARYRDGGLEGLKDRSHRPVSCPHQIPAAVDARIVDLRMAHRGWGPRRLAHQLGRDGVEPLPSISAIYRCLLRHKLIEPRKRRRKDNYMRWERGRAMELWQMDVMGGVLLHDGTELKVARASTTIHASACSPGSSRVRRPGPCAAPLSRPSSATGFQTRC